jgi:hypothetical protein
MTDTVTPLEGTRISAVLEETQERLSFLSVMTPDASAFRDEVSAMVGDEVSRLIAAQREKERRYNSLVEQRAALKGLANKSKFKEVQKEIEVLSYELRESMKNLCRSLTENPSFEDNLSRIAEERDQLAGLLEGTISDLHDGHFRTLSEFVRREKEAGERLRVVSSREEVITQEVEAVAHTIKEEEDKYNAEADAKKAEIAVLKEKLRKLKQDTSLTVRYARKEASAKSEITGRQLSTEEQAVAEKIAHIKQTIEVETYAFEASMEVLKKEQDDYAKSVEAWKQTHLKEMAEKEEELKVLTEARALQKAELDKFQWRYEDDMQQVLLREVSWCAGYHRCFVLLSRSFLHSQTPFSPPLSPPLICAGRSRVQACRCSRERSTGGHTIGCSDVFATYFVARMGCQGRQGG